MPLDALYGAGAFTALQAALTAALPGVTVTQVDNVVQGAADGTVHVEARWGSEVVKLECLPGRVHFAYLSTTCASVAGKREAGAATYKALVAHLPALLKAHGVTRLTAGQYDTGSTTALRQFGGFVPDATGLLVWVL